MKDRRPFQATTNSRRWLLFVTLLVTLFSVSLPVARAGSDKCTSSSSFYCPNCGGQEVSDCLDCDGFLSTDFSHEICFDRRLFQTKNKDESDHDDHYHFLWHDLAGAIVWFCVAGIATACGVGGGGIYVPLGNLLLQFAPKPASGLSQASIFGASLGGIFLNSRFHHPVTKIRHEPPAPPEEGEHLRHQIALSPTQEAAYQEAGGKFYTRPLINFDMALFLSPMEMAGAVLGVLIQKILPNWLYLLLAAIVLGMTAKKTYTKYQSSAAKEKKTREAAQAAEEKTQEEALPVESAAADSVEQVENVTEDTGSNGDSHKQEALELRKKYLEEDMIQFPKDKIAGLIALWIGLFVITLMKGGKGVDSIVGITCEDTAVYGFLIVIQFLCLFGLSIVFGYRAYTNQAKRLEVDYPFLPGDPVWDAGSLKTYGAFTFLAGIVAGLIGIGGGMVLGPLMLIMGIDPRVSTATTATMIVLTSSSVAVMYVTSGLVPWSYAIFFFGICLLGALVGKSKIDGYVKKTGKASLLILILATIIAVATVGCLVIMLTKLAGQDWCFDGFNKFCDNSKDEESCIVDRMLSHFSTGDYPSVHEK